MTGFSRRWRREALIGSLAAMALAGRACAEPAPPFAELLRQTANAPRSAVLNAEVDRARGLAQQARARPNPTVSAYIENFAGTSPFDGLRRSETTVQLNQPIELGGKRAARIAAGNAGVAAAQAKTVEGRLAYANDLAAAYAGVEIAERRVDRAQDEVDEAQAIARMTRAQVAAGKEARLRQLQAETVVARLEADLETTRTTRRAALDRLSALAGVAVPYTGVSESLLARFGRPLRGPPNPLANATYLAALAEREAAARRLQVERTRAIPDITAQLGVRRLQGDKAEALVAGLSIPLHVFDRNRGNIAAARAELTGAAARAEVARIEAEANLRSALAQIEAAQVRVAAAERTLATARETYRLARVAYEAGKAPLLELLTARQGIGAARDVVIDADVARFEAQAALARQRGLTITGEPVQ